MTDIATRMVEARSSLGLTQRDMAERLGIPYRTLQDGERGIAQPGAATLAAYGEQGVDLNWLVMGHKLDQAQLWPEQEQSQQDPADHFTDAIALMIGAGIGTHFRVDALKDGIRFAMEGELIGAEDRTKLGRLVQALDKDDVL